MKICYLTFEFPNDLGGAGRVAKENAHHLAESGCEVEVVAVATHKIVSDDPSFNIVHIHKKSRLPWRVYINVLLILIFKKYDVLICNDAQSMFIASFLTFIPGRAHKYYGFIHGDEVEEIIIDPSGFKKIVRFDLFYDRFLKKSEKVFFLSRFMANKFCKNFLALDSKKAVVINAGLRIAKTKVKSSISKNFGLSSPLKLISVSRIDKEKGFEEMVAILEKFFDLGFEFEWLVVGDGDFLTELKAIVTSSKINTNVRFAGAVKHDKVLSLISENEVFFLLSNYEESFGLAYAEALIMGLPIIAKARGAVLDFRELRSLVCVSESEEDYLKFLISCFQQRSNRSLISELSQKYNVCNLYQEL